MRSVFVAIVSGLFSVSAWSGTVSISALDKNGLPMSDVVFYAMPVGVPAPPVKPQPMLTIAQENRQFSPYVTVTTVGSQIKFPNYDKIEHHVKSFSPAKEFEFKIYDHGTPPPVEFDKPGIVVTYCLLHDWMRAYVMVVNTPYFAKSEKGEPVSMYGLPAGKYEIRGWHPDLGSIKPALLKTVDIDEQSIAQVRFEFGFIPKARRQGKS
jgi:hypothetical protein